MTFCCLDVTHEKGKKRGGGEEMSDMIFFSLKVNEEDEEE